MKFFLLACILVVSLKSFAFAEEDGREAEKSSKEKRIISGNFDVFSGYNNKRYIPGNERDSKPYIGFTGELLFKDLTFFGESELNKFGLNAELSINSFDSSNPIQVKEATFLISAEEIGTRIFGLQKPVTSKLKVNSSTFAGTSGGVSGNWQNFIRYPFYKSSNVQTETSAFFLTRADMPLESGITSKSFLKASENGTAFQSFEGDGESNIGISYVSQRLKGFRFGISYFPDSRTDLMFSNSDLTDAKGFTLPGDINDTYLRNIFALGLNFYDNFDNFELAFSALYEHADIVSENFNRTNLDAFSVGFNAGYLGFMVGGSFANYGGSMKIKEILMQGSNFIFDNKGNISDFNYAYVYDVGVGYSIDKYTVNLSYIQSRFSGNHFHAGAFSFETKLAKNLFNYLQFARYQFSPANQINAEMGSDKINRFVVAVGIKYKM